jgi:hypothetical protein
MTTNHGGKGDKQRPLGISQEEFDNRWDSIFKNKEEKEESPFEIEIEADNSEQKAQVTYKLPL